MEGAKSSCSVHPRVNHLLSAKSDGLLADIGWLVSSEHGVDRLGQLDAAGLVDAACVHPDIRQSALPGKAACILDLGAPCLLGAGLVFLEAYFLAVPSV